jgi:2-dehydropantoate 2-reductase
MRWKHTKLVMNLANSLEALCGRAAYDTPLLTMVRDEGMAVLRAAGIDFVSEAEDRARRGDLLRIRPIDGERRGGGSTWQSLQRGLGSVESDYLNGEIVLLGRLHGVPTPVNELLRRECNAAAHGAAAPGRMSPDELLAQLDAVS